MRMVYHHILGVRMPMNFADVDAFTRGLPGVEVGAKWGHKTWIAAGRGFAWERPLTRADLARFGDDTPPAGEILAVRLDSLDAKDALLSIAPRGFFTIAHFNGFPGILIALREARTKDVRAALLDAHRAAFVAPPPRSRAKRPAAAKPASKKPTSKKPKPAPRKPAPARPRKSRG
jgi:hypothetical protein